MPLEGAVFSNYINLGTLFNARIRITQRMAIEGETAKVVAEDIRTFQATAPQDLARLASAIEAARTADRNLQD